MAAYRAHFVRGAGGRRLDYALPFTVVTVPKSARSLKRSRELVPQHESLVNFWFVIKS